MLNALAAPAGSSLAAFGPGSVGLAAVMAARLAACSQIIAVGRNDLQLKLARDLGATDTVDTRHEDPVTASTEITRGGADSTVECTGNPAVARQAVDALRPLGTCALVGAPAPGVELSLDHGGMILGRRVIGVNGGDGQSSLFIGRLISLHEHGRFPFDRLITTYPFASINRATDDIAQRKTLKAVLQMEQHARQAPFQRNPARRPPCAPRYATSTPVQEGRGRHLANDPPDDRPDVCHPVIPAQRDGAASLRA